MTPSPITTLAQNDARRGADLLLEILESEGVEYIFGNPGTTELPLIDALVKAPSIRYILALQEASVVAMAEGYAQAAGKPGFLNLHTAGGLGHGMGNLLNASVSQTPLVVTAGQQDLRHTLTDPLLFDDLVKIATPAVKWAQEVTSPAQLPVLIRRAFHDANAAPSGPVFLSLPMDVMEQWTTASIGERSVIVRESTGGSLEELARQLAAVTPGRLAIIAGDEIHSSRAADEVVRVAEILGARVYGSSVPSRIPFPTAHPLWAGNMPMNARGIASILKDYDAIFGIGGKSLITVLYSETPAIPESCRVFQLSADVRDLGRTYHTPLSVVGHIKSSLEVLLPHLESCTEPKRAIYKGLLESAGKERDARRESLYVEARERFNEAVIPPLVAACEVVRAIGPQIPIIDEALCTSNHVRAFLSSTMAGQYSFLRGGALGWGMPAAVGRSLGMGREPVVCIVGDGAALYSPQAMWTAAHEQLPVTFIVMNNREYNILKNFLRSQVGYASAEKNEFIAMDIAGPAIDYVAMAHSYGLPACRIEKASEIGPAVEAGIRSGRGNLIDIAVLAEG